jgi:hypothetical protein
VGGPTAIGAFLPPIRVAWFITCAIARLSIVKSTKYMAPYLVILFLGLVVITCVSWLTLVLPRLFLRWHAAAQPDAVTPPLSLLSAHFPLTMSASPYR